MAAMVLLVTLVPVLGLLVTALVTWKVAKHNSTDVRRASSGTIATSDAAVLWQEGASLRDNLTQQVIGLRDQLTATNTQLKESNSQISTLLKEVTVSNALNSSLTKEVAASNASNASLLNKITASNIETATAREETRLLRLAVEEVHAEVKTANGLSMGMLADNMESRRIAEIPPAKRTPDEAVHIETIGIQTFQDAPDARKTPPVLPAVRKEPDERARPRRPRRAPEGPKPT